MNSISTNKIEINTNEQNTWKEAVKKTENIPRKTTEITKNILISKSNLQPQIDDV